MRGWWQDLTDLVLPAECGGCGAPRTVLCPECRTALHRVAPGRVRPAPEPAGLPSVHAVAPYTDEVRAMLLAHKERGALALARPLGAVLTGAVRAGLREAVAGFAASSVPGGDRRVRVVSSWGAGVAPGAGPSSGTGGVPGRRGAGAAVVLVPVPSAVRAVRARGHDPVRRIALATAGELRRTGTPARVAGVLRQRRTVADQSGLNSRQRLANLEGALEVTAGGARLLAGGHVVLVDDLMTTGASLTEAARAVREAVAYGGGTTAVYPRATREGRGERTPGSSEEKENPAPDRPRMAEVNGVVRSICAAVIAAPPDSFEINRN